ncbi:hypothetical protein SAMN04487983_1003275 [Streptomyces sp. yr375]|nr:hypothetical protein SAMN04487983_1003275 [Streptomyces sp. yr375]
MNEGIYVSLDAGNVSFEVFADEWLKGRGADSVEVYRRHLRVHAYPVIDRKTLAALASRPSTVGKWASGIEASPNYKRDIMQTVTAVFAAAVDDGLIKRNPMKSRQVTKPKREKKKIVPWTADRVGTVVAALDHLTPRYACTGVVGATSGQRQGKIFGFSPDDVLWDAGRIKVMRQIKEVRGGGANRLIFALPKTKETREFPAPAALLRGLKAHMEIWPPVAVTLPWGSLDGEPVTVRLFFTTPYGMPLDASVFNRLVWKPALAQADVIPAPVGRRYAAAPDDGMHALRHHYVSALLSAGESLVTAAEFIGDTLMVTAETYAHLMEGDGSRGVAALDRSLGGSVDALRLAV